MRVLALIVMVAAQSAGDADLPEASKDGRYKTKVDACQVCKHHNTKSCATYQSCICYAANTAAWTATYEEVDASWRFGCNMQDAGDNYQICFENREVNVDSFGDTVDPNNPKC